MRKIQGLFLSGLVEIFRVASENNIFFNNFPSQICYDSATGKRLY
jgi:hypothetical protein